ncbi:uncharacterized protein DUF2628 [Acinetobacter calcoaceticus]|uniref:Uncharacterized protein DUF2628 n=1 Tax=Acinetobacter calcoaceticus TaxID=471 RepID=A0A4R1Y2B5_ACICA|nr:uncharacterized protein DUF2628 [Acinetobacter calcoaceticus]
MTQDHEVLVPPFPIDLSKPTQQQAEFSPNRKRAYFIGKQFNAYYYEKFKKKAAQKPLDRFHQAAFFLGFVWLFYRKMYLYGSMHLLLSLFVFFLAEYLDLHGLVLYLIIAMLLGFYANPLYKSFVDQKIIKIETRHHLGLRFELIRQGGTHRFAALMSLLVAILSLLIASFL